MASIFAARAAPYSQNFAAPLADRPAADASDDETFEIADRSVDESASRLKEKPELLHHLQNDSSILTLAVGGKLLYAGTQDGEIVVWSLASFELVQRIQAHTRAVLSLFLSADGKFLFSSAGDAIVNVWCTNTLKRLYHIYSTYDVGDVFSVAYSAQFETVYLGAQNTSIQWCSLKDQTARRTPNPDNHPDRRNHRFFDSLDRGGSSTPRPQTTRTGNHEGEVLEIDKAHMMHYAHFGYVYCMLMVHGVTRLVDSDEDFLISGGGDGTIKIWKLFDDQNQGINEVACLGDDDAESVLSLAIDGSFLYSSKLEGVIELWDLDTKQKLRVIKAHKGDVTTLQMGWGFLWSAGSTGFARVRILGFFVVGNLLMDLNRNTPLYNTENTRIRLRSVKNITASIAGELTKAGSWPLQSPLTMSSNFTSREPTIILSLYGISLVAIRVVMIARIRCRCPIISCLNPFRNSSRSKPYPRGQIMRKTADEEPLFCERSSRNTVRKRRC
jgi:di- and tripeptidase